LRRCNISCFKPSRSSALNSITKERHSSQSVFCAAKKPSNQRRLLQHLTRRKLHPLARKLTRCRCVCTDSATRETVNNPLANHASKRTDASTLYRRRKTVNKRAFRIAETSCATNASANRCRPTGSSAASSAARNVATGRNHSWRNRTTGQL